MEKKKGDGERLSSCNSRGLGCCGTWNLWCGDYGKVDFARHGRDTVGSFENYRIHGNFFLCFGCIVLGIENDQWPANAKN